MARKSPRTVNSPLFRRASLLDRDVQKLKPTARLVYAGVVQSMDGANSVPGLVFATTSALADELGLSDRQVANALRAIVRAGLGLVCSRHGVIFLGRELGVERTKIVSADVWTGTKKVLAKALKSSVGRQVIAYYQAHMSSLGDHRCLDAELAAMGDPSPRPLPEPLTTLPPYPPESEKRSEKRKTLGHDARYTGAVDSVDNVQLPAFPGVPIEELVTDVTAKHGPIAPTEASTQQLYRPVEAPPASAAAPSPEPVVCLEEKSEAQREAELVADAKLMCRAANATFGTRVPWEDSALQAWREVFAYRPHPWPEDLRVAARKRAEHQDLVFSDLNCRTMAGCFSDYAAHITGQVIATK